MPENFYKTIILRKKRILRDRIDYSVTIEQDSLSSIVDVSNKNKESAQKLKKLDLWFLALAFSHLMIYPRF